MIILGIFISFHFEIDTILKSNSNTSVHIIRYNEMDYDNKNRVSLVPENPDSRTARYFHCNCTYWSVHLFVCFGSFSAAPGNLVPVDVSASRRETSDGHLNRGLSEVYYKSGKKENYSQSLRVFQKTRISLYYIIFVLFIRRIPVYFNSPAQLGWNIIQS